MSFCPLKAAKFWLLKLGGQTDSVCLLTFQSREKEHQSNDKSVVSSCGSTVKGCNQTLTLHLAWSSETLETNLTSVAEQSANAFSFAI